MRKWLENISKNYYKFQAFLCSKKYSVIGTTVTVYYEVQ